jgi:hypothetical protein
MSQIPNINMDQTFTKIKLPHGTPYIIHTQREVRLLLHTVQGNAIGICIIRKEEKYM